MGDLPTWISAFATIILVYVTYRYVRLVKAQSDTMTNQGSIMQESIKRDRITRKYNGLSKEMDDLVGPLFSKMDDSTAPFFTVVSHSSEYGPYFQEIYAFWRDIKKNMYLAPTGLRVSISNYLDARQKYRRVLKVRSTPGDEVATVKAIFDSSVGDLKPKVKVRYNELSGQLEECRRELEN